MFNEPLVDSMSNLEKLKVIEAVWSSLSDPSDLAPGGSGRAKASTGVA